MHACLSHWCDGCCKRWSILENSETCVGRSILCPSCSTIPMTTPWIYCKDPFVKWVEEVRNV